jgi:hypothetical protein
LFKKETNRVIYLTPQFEYELNKRFRETFKKDYEVVSAGDAEEAMPTPMGKLLSLSTAARRSSPAIWRTASSMSLTRSSPALTSPITCSRPR